MDRFIATRSISEELTSDILKIAALAKKDRAEGNKVIDASIGVFLNEDKSLNSVDLVKESLQENILTDLSYPNIYGSKEFKEGVLKWLFKSRYEEVVNKYLIPFGATLGGTGACHIAFSNYVEAGDYILLPSIMWSNYRLIAQKAGAKSTTYELFNEQGQFNVDDLISKIEQLSLSQKKILVVINDPCQNPTGYSLSDDEYDYLLEKVNQISNKISITILFDIAYLCYDDTCFKPHRLFLKILDTDLNFLPLFAFSASKAFGMYGLRVGALFALCTTSEINNNFLTSFANMARGVYSCPNGPALISLSSLLNNPYLLEKANENIDTNSSILRSRGEMIIELLKKYNIHYLPYKNGFFISIQCQDSQKVYESLIKKHIYIVPLDKQHIRVALSGLSLEEIPIFVDALLLAINL